MSKASYRLAALFSHPIQYFAPLFRQVAARQEIDLTVFFCSRKGLEEYEDPKFGQSVKWDIPLLEGYKYKFLSNVGKGKGFWSLLNPGIVKELSRNQYDAVWVHGYMQATNWLAFMVADAIGMPVLLRGESHLLKPRPTWVLTLKSIILRRLFDQIEGFLYIGTRNREYYEYYGVTSERLFFTPYCVDNEFFGAEYLKLEPKRELIRARFGIHDDRPVLLFVGKFYDVKQPLRLLAAYEAVRKSQRCALLCVGDGPMRFEMESLIRRRGIPDVHITGFINQSEIPSAYVAGDILLLTSWRETWGLTVNEAMNFGLPIVVSDRVGCAPDLVQEGKNGAIVPYDDVGSWVSVIESLVSNSKLRDLYGKHSSEIIREWGFDECVDGLVQALKATI